MKLLKRLRVAYRAVSDAVSAGRRWSIFILPEGVDTAVRVAPSRYISVAACIKNEAAYLAEWLDFHHRLGVERFILYDNGSTDDLHAVCKPYVDAGLVTLIPWANFSVWFNQQRGAYAHALMNFGAQTTWMGFFDIDEFMFPVQAASLVPVLREREHLPVLAATGINFGTGGHRQRPSEGVTRSYRMAVPLALQRDHTVLLNTKCFVRPPCIEAVVSLHWFRIKGDTALAYTEHGHALRGHPSDDRLSLSADVIRYNHYFTRSVEEFERKCSGSDARGVLPRWNNTRRHRQGMFKLIERLAQEDRAIEPLLQPVGLADRGGVGRRQIDASADGTDASVAERLFER